MNTELLKIRDVFNAVVRDRNLKILKTTPSSTLSIIYSVLDEIVNSLFNLEFYKENTGKTEFVKNLLQSFSMNAEGMLNENLFIKEFLTVAVPMLYVCEEELKLKTAEELEDSQFVEIFVLFFTLMLRGIPKDRKIKLRIVELKQYSKTRIDLDPDDFVDLSRDEIPFIGIKACVYQVNRLRVLCGFFNEDGKWRSEKYANPMHLQNVLEKYNLICKK